MTKPSIYYENMPNDPVTYLNSLGLHTVKPGLERITAILSALGSPELKVPGIIIGGTNGKGSVASSIASVLIKSGYKTGLYTSPHLIKINERIRINGSQIADEELNEFIERVRVASEELSIGPSYFEVMTACAFSYFADMGCQVNVLEVGMGGRWDATNVLSPLVTVITNISKDHTEYLGDTIEKIAHEKACLIKPGRPVVTGARGEALDVISEVSHKNKAPLYVLDRDFRLKEIGKELSYIGNKWKIDNIYTNLTGLYQRENLSLAIKALEEAQETGNIRIEEDAVRKGLSQISWEGRFEEVREDPPLVLDSAHNPGAAAALVSSLRNSYPGVKFTFLIGMLGDKDHSDFISQISALADEIILTRVPSERSADTESLTKSAGEHKNKVMIIEDYREAFEMLRNSGKPGCVTGSLYLIGALKEIKE